MGVLNPNMVDGMLSAVYNQVQLVNMVFHHHRNVDHGHDHRCSWTAGDLGNTWWVVRVAVYMVYNLYKVTVGMRSDLVHSNRSPDGIGALHRDGSDSNTNPFQTMEHRLVHRCLDLDPLDPIDS